MKTEKQLGRSRCCARAAALEKQRLRAKAGCAARCEAAWELTTPKRAIARSISSWLPRKPTALLILPLARRHFIAPQPPPTHLFSKPNSNTHCRPAALDHSYPLRFCHVPPTRFPLCVVPVIPALQVPLARHVFGGRRVCPPPQFCTACPH